MVSLLVEFEAIKAMFGSAAKGSLPSPSEKLERKMCLVSLPRSLDFYVNDLFLAGLGEPNWLISMRHGHTWLSKAKQKLS